MATPRSYTASDADMLLVAATIVENGIAAKEFLVSKRPAWQDPFFPDLQKRVNKAFTDILGINAHAELNAATRRLNRLRAEILNNIAELKVQVKVDYTRGEAEALLNKLGIGRNNPGYRKRNEALLKAVQTLKTNLTPGLKGELEAKGIAPALTNSLIEQSDAFLQTEIQQETLKGGGRSITEAGITELNAVYTEVIGIAKIARNFFKGQPVEQAKFSFEKLIRTQSAGNKSAAPAEK